MATPKFISTNWTARRVWHKVTSTESIGGGRYTRFNLACGLNPHGKPVEVGKGFLQNSAPVVTSDRIVDVMGDPPETSAYLDNPAFAPDMLKVCEVCFPEHKLAWKAY